MCLDCFLYKYVCEIVLNIYLFCSMFVIFVYIRLICLDIFRVYGLGCFKLLFLLGKIYWFLLFFILRGLYGSLIKKNWIILERECSVIFFLVVFGFNKVLGFVLNIE